MANPIVKNLSIFFKKKKPLVNTFILGVQKSGTSSLYQYLLMHPDCGGGNEKEIHFFDTDSEYKKGVDEYHGRFKKGKKVLIDASPSYIYRKSVILRLKEYNPNAKFIILLRNPIDRAFSAWNMYKQMYASHRDYFLSKKDRNVNNRMSDFLFSDKFPSLKEVIAQEMHWINNQEDVDEPSIVRRGFYSDQLSSWFEHFPRENFFIIICEDFRINKERILTEICTFLEIKKIQWNNKILNEVHVRKYNEELKKEDREVLKQIYKDRNRELPDLLNFMPPW